MNFKQKAEEKFEELEMPSSIRTPGRTWTRYPDVEEFNIKEKDFQPEMDVEGEAEVFTGEEAIEAAGDKLFDSIKVDEDRMNAFHAANLNSIIYIEAEGEAEVQLDYDTTSNVFSHLVVETSRNAELTVTESLTGTNEIQTSFNEFYLGENSTLRYGSVEASESELSYSRRKAVLDRDAKIEWLNSQFEGDLNRTKVETVLKGDNSEADMQGIWYPTEDQHVDISLHVRHIGTNTRCDMDSRAVVDDEARSVYEGLQKVEDEADDTQSFQNENVLTLSNDAEVDASPKLMIEDPDVEASHAASAGNLPEKELHYLESRGLSEEKAQRLIVKGFFEPVLKEVELPDLKERIRDEVERKLK
ncbi:MAG: SufD family Fe-S cluster assembly protein [Nanohaloarchaea archaeon]|nr:SufD family Fe-S cluster assembly protein [Candidatus Nanohaloarchaea archaeon]